MFTLHVCSLCIHPFLLTFFHTNANDFMCLGNTKEFTIGEVQRLQHIHENHHENVEYVTPCIEYAGETDDQQAHLFKKTGLMDAPVVGLDLRCEKPECLANGKGVIYTASVLTLSCSKGT